MSRYESSKDHHSRHSKSVKKSFMIKSYKLGGSPKCVNNKSYNPPSFKAVPTLEKDSKFSIQNRFYKYSGFIFRDLCGF